MSPHSSSVGRRGCPSGPWSADSGVLDQCTPHAPVCKKCMCDHCMHVFRWTMRRIWRQSSAFRVIMSTICCMENARARARATRRLRASSVIRNLSSSHGEGDEEGGGGGPDDEEGQAQGDEGAEGHEVSRGRLLPLVRSGPLVAAPAPVRGCLRALVERGRACVCQRWCVSGA